MKKTAIRMVVLAALCGAYAYADIGATPASGCTNPLNLCPKSGCPTGQSCLPEDDAKCIYECQVP